MGGIALSRVVREGVVHFERWFVDVIGAHIHGRHARKRAMGTHVIENDAAGADPGTDPGFPMHVGAAVTVGHLVMLHGCTIGANSLIGIKSVIMNGADIGEGCIIGANSLIAEGKRIPPRSLVLGSPGRVVREVSDEETALLRGYVDEYLERIDRYRSTLKPDSGVRD